MILLRESAANHTRGGSLTLQKTFNASNMTSGAGTQDVASFVPAGLTLCEIYLALVDTILAGAGMTTWSVGTSGDTNRYGATLALAAGTAIGPADYAADWGAVGGAARDLRYTSAVGNFTTGVIRSELIYATASALHA